MTNLTFGIIIGASVIAALWACTELYRALSASIAKDDDKDNGVFHD